MRPIRLAGLLAPAGMLLVAAMLTGCGQTGPLFLPEAESAEGSQAGSAAAAESAGAGAEDRESDDEEAESDER